MKFAESWGLSDMRHKLFEMVANANTGADAIKRAPIVSENTGLRCLRIGDVSQGRPFSEWGFTKTTDDDFNKYQLKAGDTIIARTGNTIGVNTYIDAELQSVYNNGLIRIQVNQDVIHPRYFYYLVRSKGCQDFIQSIAFGTSTQPNMKIKDFLQYEFEYFDKDVQDKIIRIIDPIEEKIKLNNEINSNLEQQAYSIYQAMFSSDNQPNGVLSDIADITMGQSPSGDSLNEENGTVFYQGRTDFTFRFPSVRLFTTEPKRMALKNDVLLSVRAPVGDINVALDDCCIGRGLAAIHSKDNKQSFVYYTVKALYPAFDMFNGEGTVFGSINKIALNSMPIYIPDIDEIDKFEHLVSPMDRLILENHQENIRLQGIRDSLLPKLMSGEIDLSSASI